MYSCDCDETTKQENGIVLGLSSGNDLARLLMSSPLPPGKFSIGIVG